MEETPQLRVMDKEGYSKIYQESVRDPQQFWGARAQEYTWFKQWNTVLQGEFSQATVQWFSGGVTNLCVNCLDRHLEQSGEKVAFYWEGDDTNHTSSLTYKELHESVSRLANVLKGRGIKKGDRVCIYLPMIPEAFISMLACARIGAVHSVVFSGFSMEALQNRIQDANCSLVITADGGVRGGKTHVLKKKVDVALENCASVHSVLVVQRTKGSVEWKEGRDYWYHEEITKVSHTCEPEHLEATDPAFILYTSGSTGKPKGVLHSVGGYMVYAGTTFQHVFDYKKEDVFWCTADVGWITGHSYMCYGPLLQGATQVIFEGVPTYPNVSRLWEVVDKYKVSLFYTAPTAIRALMRHGDDPVKNCSRSSLRILGSVGEPINPAAWQWYHTVVGEGRCPIVDTWWQTETGGIMLTPLPGVTQLKPGSACQPFFGIVPELVDENGNVLEGEATGNLCIAQPWPGMLTSVFGDHERCISTYFSQFPGKYFTGDECRRDADGYLWITGRVDDVLNVSGHRIGTAEVESVLVSHEKVAEAAVVGCKDEVKGQGIYAYVTLMQGVDPSEELQGELVALVREKIGPIATPKHIQWAPALPKTRSGKIMRRILRKIALGDTSELGDTSTLADVSVLDALISGRQD